MSIKGASTSAFLDLALCFLMETIFFLTDKTYKSHETYNIWIQTIISRVFISHIWQHFYGRSFVKLCVSTALFFIIYFIFPIKVLLLLCDIHVRVCMLWCTCERQNLNSLSPPFIFTCVSESSLSNHGSAASVLYPLNQPTLLN